MTTVHEVSLHQPQFQELRALGARTSLVSFPGPAGLEIQPGDLVRIMELIPGPEPRWSGREALLQVQAVDPGGQLRAQIVHFRAFPASFPAPKGL